MSRRVAAQMPCSHQPCEPAAQTRLAIPAMLQAWQPPLSPAQVARHRRQPQVALPAQPLGGRAAPSPAAGQTPCSDQTTVTVEVLWPGQARRLVPAPQQSSLASLLAARRRLQKKLKRAQLPLGRAAPSRVAEQTPCSDQPAETAAALPPERARPEMPAPQLQPSSPAPGGRHRRQEAVRLGWPRPGRVVPSPAAEQTPCSGRSVETAWMSLLGQVRPQAQAPRQQPSSPVVVLATQHRP